MAVTISYKLLNDQYRSLIKSGKGTWEPTYKVWKIPRDSYTFLRTEMPLVNPDILFQDPPDLVDRAVRDPPENLNLKKLKKVIAYDEKDKERKIQLNPLFNKLYPFQRDSLALSVKKYGRLLIADEMGVGKTLQSLACALEYKQDWPLLIICPSTLKYTWQFQLEKWYKQNDIVYKQQIQILSKGNNQIRFNQIKVLICSYEIATKLTDQLNGFKVVIADQAHYLKNSTAQRTQILTPYLASRKRIFLLTGTPAFAKPRQLFNLLSIIRPDVYYDIKQFGDRYCCLQRNPWSGAMQYEGSRNSNQLHYILKNKVMIRRLKMQVLHDLPPKQRQLITVQTDKQIIKEIKELLKTQNIHINQNEDISEKMIQSMLNSSFGNNSSNNNNDQQGEQKPSYTNRTAVTKCFQLSGMAKIQSTKQYVKSIMQNDVKIIIFAHHRNVLDQLQTFVINNLKIRHIRIDGQVPQQTRQKRVKQFEDQVDIRIALLSITCAGVGYTLISASTIIFAQLHWTPGIIIQAQDRAHRIGQKYCVNIHYLIGQGTFDTILYKLLEKKTKTVGQILDAKNQNLDIQKLQQGKIGKITILDQQKQYNEKKDKSKDKSTKKSKITDYFEIQRSSEIMSAYQQQRISQQQKRQQYKGQEQKGQEQQEIDLDLIDQLIRRKKAQLQQLKRQQDNHHILNTMRIKKEL